MSLFHHIFAVVKTSDFPREQSLHVASADCLHFTTFLLWLKQPFFHVNRACMLPARRSADCLHSTAWNIHFLEQGLHVTTADCFHSTTFSLRLKLPLSHVNRACMQLVQFVSTSPHFCCGWNIWFSTWTGLACYQRGLSPLYHFCCGWNFCFSTWTGLACS